METGNRDILNKRAPCHDFSLQRRGTLLKASGQGNFRKGRTVGWFGRGMCSTHGRLAAV
jgi:hypothetical protein